MSEGVSFRTVHRAWEALKSTLEYLHLTEFVLHVSHSDVFSLLILAFTCPQGWIAISSVAAAWSLWLKLHRPRQEGTGMNATDQGTNRELPAPPTHEPAALTIVAPSVLQSLAELAQQGVGVKIVIELTPPER